ncbi:flagellar protein FlaG [Vibrio ziniensis]|uniref:Flagellar protein FlaG n=1 Tax=Vibrio ziniensis TaxID=2711221 RepID=A0A6G7CJZ8_9VIBR|nr:flagellar protein FlaG [Vibrio ziniensis]QIH42429.1 flagellar protein FlaG [Vibrio ziniensis]
METPLYTSNVQPFGSQSGIKFASEKESVSNISTSKREERPIESSEKVSEHITNQVKKTKQLSIEAAIESSRERDKLNEERRAKMVEQVSEFVNSINKGLAFRIDEESGHDVVTVYEASTGDIIRQIPEEEMLEVLRRLSRQQDHKSGLLSAKV